MVECLDPRFEARTVDRVGDLELRATTLAVSSDQLGGGLADGAWALGIAVVDNILAWNQERRAGLRIVAQLERSTVLAFLRQLGAPVARDAGPSTFGA